MGNEQENSEKIARVETEVKTTFEWFKDVLGRIEAKLDSHAEKYVTKESLHEILRSRDENSANQQKQITEIKEDKKTNRRMLPDIIIAASAIGQIALTVYLVFHK